MTGDFESQRQRRASLAAIEAALANADPSAFALAHRELAPGVRTFFARRGVRQGDVVDDLAQQTWSQVWQSLVQRRFDPRRAAISTFVYAVAHHVWLQACRRWRLERHPDAGGARPLTSAPDALAQAAAQAELLEAARDCLAAQNGPAVLTAQERRIVEAIANGATERDLARLLNLAPSTINARKKAAYERIRACLRAKGFSDDAIEQAAFENE